MLFVEMHGYGLVRLQQTRQNNMSIPIGERFADGHLADTNVRWLSRSGWWQNGYIDICDWIY